MPGDDEIKSNTALSLANKTRYNLFNCNILPLLQASSPRVLMKYLSVADNLWQTINNLWGTDELSCYRLHKS